MTIEYSGTLSNEQVMEAVAYATLYALGGYTYNNVVQEAPDEQCNSANNEEVDIDNDLEDKEGI